MRPSDHIERQIEYEIFSRSIQIGIYGYYDPQNRIELRKLKQFLIEHNLNVKMAEDFENFHFPVISSYSDAIKCSQMLFDSSLIHIFIVTQKIEVERDKLLDSLSMEYGWAWRPRQEYVGVYFQKIFDVSTLPLGAIQTMEDRWSTENFDNINEIFSIVLRYCEYAIRKMFILSDSI